MLFGLLALLTGLAVFAILWPLSRRARTSDEHQPVDVAFYKAKLAEIDRETANDLLSAEDAEAAKTEAARRLLRAAESDPALSAVPPKDRVASSAAAQWRLRLAAILALSVVPAVSIGLYLYLGHPSWPDEPLAARLNAPGQNMTLAEAVAKVEAHLRKDPNDGRGYEVLVPAYLRLGRIEDAVRVAGLAMQKLGATPDRQAIYGETLVYASRGVVTEAARELFQKAANANPPPEKALYYLGLAANEDGDKAKAASYWQKLLAMMPQGSRARADLEKRIAALEGKAPPQASEAAAIARMTPEAQAAAIHGMIDRLAARLAQNGNDIEGWLRLVRAYKVINEVDKARAALATARHDFSGDAQATARIDALARELGLDS
jgi:cytochrome c-type biogenesis protein CcmH